jgi:pimeloyl-ACP methyl ester carboxylesterase
MQHDSLTVSGAAGAVRTFHWPGSAPPSTPALVFVHGMLGDATFWAPTITALDALDAPRARGIAIELRGHGGSEPAEDGDYSPPACARDVLAMLDAYGLDRATIVGHSYGSLVALAFAALAPRRVARLVLVDPPGDFTRLPAATRRDELEPFLAALAGDGWREATRAGFEDALRGGRESTRQEILARLERAPRDATVSLFRPMFEYPSTGTLGAYLGRADASALAILAPSNAWPFSLHVLCPALEHVVVPDTGHWLILDDPAGFARALTNTG